ncbi:MAG: hypothetical protein WA921_02975 [Ahrensia sp.]
MTINIDPETLKRQFAAQRAEIESSTPRRRASDLFMRTPVRKLSIPRVLTGGRLNDAGRLPRYVVTSALVLAAIWVPVGSYITLTPESFTSKMSLILPGTGLSTSVNLSDIGQTSTSANSAFSSSGISPTVTYQKLFQSGRVITRAATSMGMSEADFGQPRIRLVDQTSFIGIEMAGASPNEARQKVEALLDAFDIELAALREDELQRREQSVTGTVDKYQKSVNDIRDSISKLQLKTGLRSEGQFDKIVDANEDLLTQITIKQASLDEINAAIATLQRLLGISPETASATMKLHADPEYSALSNALSDAAAETAALAQRFGPKHPEILVSRKAYLGIRIKMLDRAIAVTGLSVEKLEGELERAADGERGQMLASLVRQVAERDGLQAQIAALNAAYETNNQRSAELIESASELEKLNRNYKVAEAVFTSALAKVSVSRTDIFASYPMAQIAEPASLPWKASSPNIMVAIIAGVAASLFAFIGLGIGWIRRPLINRIMLAIVGKREYPDEPA